MENKPGPDLCMPCGEGLLNIRVGAIIIKGGKALMVKSKFGDYCYSVGGRIKFGETAEQAVVREVFEETGAIMTVDRLGCVSEVYFYNDSPKLFGKPVYELAFYFYMNVPADFTLESDHRSEPRRSARRPRRPIKKEPDQSLAPFAAAFLFQNQGSQFF